MSTELKYYFRVGIVKSLQKDKKVSTTARTIYAYQNIVAEGRGKGAGIGEEVTLDNLLVVT